MEFELDILIYDWSQKVVDQWIETFILDGFADNAELRQKYNIKFKCGKAEKIAEENGPFDAIVSAANSLMFMDGGTDMGYMMYYGKREIDIQKRAQENVKRFGFETALGRPCLPIGCCMLTTFDDVPALISAPTMHLPGDVSETENAKYAMYSVLRFLYWYNKHGIGRPIRKIMVPSFCTGYGKMDPHKAAHQTFTAMEMTLKPRFTKKAKGENFYEYGYTIEKEPEQPSTHSNKEFIEIKRLSEDNE